MKPNPVIWFEIYVDDLGRAQKFYEKVFDFKMEPMADPSGQDTISMVSFPMNNTSPGAGGMLAKMEGFPAGGNSTIVYFSSEDCSIEEKRVVEAGGRIQKSKHSIGPYGFIALAIDTEKNMFGIHSMK